MKNSCGSVAGIQSRKREKTALYATKCTNLRYRVSRPFGDMFRRRSLRLDRIILTYCGGRSILCDDASMRDDAVQESPSRKLAEKFDTNIMEVAKIKRDFTPAFVECMDFLCPREER